jgi:hypothetical protein
LNVSNALIKHLKLREHIKIIKRNQPKFNELFYSNFVGEHQPSGEINQIIPYEIFR